MFGLENNSPEIVDEKYAWRGFDDRGLELDIVAVSSLTVCWSFR
jgi:hypothetical protein